MSRLRHLQALLVCYVVLVRLPISLELGIAVLPPVRMCPAFLLLVPQGSFPLLGVSFQDEGVDALCWSKMVLPRSQFLLAYGCMEQKLHLCKWPVFKVLHLRADVEGGVAKVAGDSERVSQGLVKLFPGFLREVSITLHRAIHVQEAFEAGRRLGEEYHDRPPAPICREDMIRVWHFSCQHWQHQGHIQLMRAPGRQMSFEPMFNLLQRRADSVQVTTGQSAAKLLVEEIKQLLRLQ
mmetsp:Transcript_55460/g.130165  ORF Transcript_55460/g.130165 Transcript_55460/m.130165 type:complete len:237 (-) Transcript_55460:674-1384(-)